MHKPSIKTVAIRKILLLGGIFLTVILLIIAAGFHSLINKTMIDKGTTLAQSIETALASHMVAGDYKDKELIINLAGQMPGVEGLEVIRSASVNRQFSLSETAASHDNHAVKKVMESAEPRYILPSFGSSNPYLRIVYPYLATDSGNLNCTTCHQARSGEVLAVIDFKVDMTRHYETSFSYLYILLGAFILAMAGISLFIHQTINKSVKAPLETLIKESKSSYQQHTEIDTQLFDSMELDHVAREFNQLNQLVLKQNDDLRTMNREIEATQSELIHAMGYIGEARSKETASHVVRVSEVSYLLARHLKLSDDMCEWIKKSSPMHDIGKVGIPDAILHKPSALSAEEFEQMKQHSTWGHEVFRHSERPLLKAASIISHQHHERWDGKGYPQGISGEEIHIYGRIVAVADVFDALLSKRSYKEPWSADKVRDYFTENAGRQFDPDVAKALLENFDQAIGIISGQQ